MAPSRRGSGATGNRRLRLVGLLVTLAGLLVLGYVGWQLVVTTWLAQREHAATVDRLEQQWTDGERLVQVEAGTSDAVLRVPRFGRDFAVPVLEGTSDAALSGGVGHFTGSAEPGGTGNFALAGHRVTHGEPFRDLPALRPGDEVLVETIEATYTYRVDTGGEDLTVPFTETWVVDRVPRNPDSGEVGPDPDERRLITLTTCSELFNTDDRLVVFGHLVEVEPR